MLPKSLNSHHRPSKGWAALAQSALLAVSIALLVILVGLAVFGLASDR